MSGIDRRSFAGLLLLGGGFFAARDSGSDLVGGGGGSTSPPMLENTSLTTSTSGSDIVVTVDGTLINYGGPTTHEVTVRDQNGTLDSLTADLSESEERSVSFAPTYPEADIDQSSITLTVDNGSDTSTFVLDVPPAQTPDYVVDNFEDGDKTVLNSNWSGWNGDTADGTFDIKEVANISGSYSGYLQSSNADVSINTVRDSVHQPDRIAVDVLISDHTGSTDDAFQIRLYDAGTFFLQLNFRGNNDLETDNSGVVGTWSVDQTLSVELRNIDWSNDTFDLYLNDSAVSSGDSFSRASPSGVDEIKFRGFSAGSGGTINALIDSVESGSGSTSGGGGSTAEFGGGTVEDFEDNDLTASATDWGSWTGMYKNGVGSGSVVGGNLTVESTDPISGSYHGELTTEGDDPRAILSTENGTYSPSTVSVKYRKSTDTGNSNDGTKFELRANGSLLIQGGLECGGGTIEAENTDTGETWQPGTTYLIEWTNIDWSANTADFAVDGTVVASDVGMRQSVDGLDAIGIRTHTGNGAGDSSGKLLNLFFDDLEMTL